MMSIAPIRSPAAAGAYFNKDDYYVADAGAPSAWAGSGAAALEIAGPVGRAQFEEMLNGNITPQVRLGFSREGEWKHLPGWDMTFSAPKSLSILAEVAGDTRLVTAHDEAVRRAIGFAEQNYAVTRTKDGHRINVIPTGNLLAATFRHDLSRAQDPQLHTHVVVMNATLHEGKWRSLHSRELYHGKMDIGLFYRQELAKLVTGLGYDIERSEGGRFEVAGVTQDVRDEFSARARAMRERLEQAGFDRDKVSAATMAAVALQTRDHKKLADREALYLDWRDRLGGRAGLVDALVEASKAKLAASGSDDDKKRVQDQAAAAQDALARAVSVLNERQATFPVDELVRVASELGLGKATRADIIHAMSTKERDGDLKRREVTAPDIRTGMDGSRAGYTTAKAKSGELELVEIERRGRDRVTPLMNNQRAQRFTAAAAKGDAAGYAWNDRQLEAARVILSARHRYVGLQGHAGVAKTTTVLKTVADAARARQMRIHAIAPTASAAQTLGEAIGVKGETMHSFVAWARAQRRGEGGRALWILDEASFAGTKMLGQLMKQAERLNARLVLVGDVKQLGAVERGAPFRQLQNAGMRTAVLDTIVRQKNQILRDAILDTIDGRVHQAIAKINAGGGAVFSHEDAAERRGQMAAAFLALSPVHRNKTIVVDPTHEGRDAVTAMIRQGLVAEGSLSAESTSGATLVPRPLTKVEQRDAAFFDVGELVRLPGSYFGQSTATKSLAYWRVIDRRSADNVVTLEAPDGTQRKWEPAKYRGTVNSYRVEHKDLRVGDRIKWSENNKPLGRFNGRGATVRAVDAAAGTAVVELDGGATQMLNLNDRTDQHWTHAYVQTAYEAQGRTAERAIVHAESWRINVTNLKSWYVQITRPTDHVLVVTDSPGKLTDALMGRADEKSTAIDVTLDRANDHYAMPDRMKAYRDHLFERVAQGLRTAIGRPRPTNDPSLDPVGNRRPKR
jgi:conjugative relaxase-like TrwC/TraI family protein